MNGFWDIIFYILRIIVQNKLKIILRISNSL